MSVRKARGSIRVSTHVCPWEGETLCHLRFLFLVRFLHSPKVRRLLSFVQEPQTVSNADLCAIDLIYLSCKSRVVGAYLVANVVRDKADADAVIDV